MTTLKGMYMHPDQCAIGNATSENTFLAWCIRQGVNMLNCYARSFLYTESNRTKFAAFVAKAKNSYGIILVTVDVRFSNSSELPGWQAYFAKYANGISSIEALTEKEPWVKNSSGVYDYPGYFNLLRTMGPLCKQYGSNLNFYEGWVGSNYANPQEAVDEMVNHCGRIFISNYISLSDYNSTSTSLGKWDNRMDKRCAAIAVAAQKLGKVAQIVEILSLEREMWGADNEFLGSVFESHSFYGSTYTNAVNAYNGYSTPAVLQYTDLVGRTIFYSKYAMLARP